MNKNIMHNIILLFIILCIFGMISIYFMMFIPIKILEVNDIITVDKPIYNSGDIVTYNVHYCKYKSVPATVNHILKNEILIHYAELKSNSKIGCHDKKTEIELPFYAPSGEYELEINLYYKLNYFRTIKYTFTTEKFKVVNIEELKSKDLILT